MAFGKLAIQVLKVVPDGDIGRLKEITVGQGWGDWENIALQIWPLKGEPVNWPPAERNSARDGAGIVCRAIPQPG